MIEANWIDREQVAGQDCRSAILALPWETNGQPVTRTRQEIHTALGGRWGISMVGLLLRGDNLTRPGGELEKVSHGRYRLREPSINP